MGVYLVGEHSVGEEAIGFINCRRLELLRQWLGATGKEEPRRAADAKRNPLIDHCKGKVQAELLDRQSCVADGLLRRELEHVK